MATGGASQDWVALFAQPAPPSLLVGESLTLDPDLAPVDAAGGWPADTAGLVVPALTALATAPAARLTLYRSAVPAAQAAAAIVGVLGGSAGDTVTAPARSAADPVVDMLGAALDDLVSTALDAYARYQRSPQAMGDTFALFALWGAAHAVTLLAPQDPRAPGWSEAYGRKCAVEKALAKRHPAVFALTGGMGSGVGVTLADMVHAAAACGRRPSEANGRPMGERAAARARWFYASDRATWRRGLSPARDELPLGAQRLCSAEAAAAALPWAGVCTDARAAAEQATAKLGALWRAPATPAGPSPLEVGKLMERVGVHCGEWLVHRALKAPAKVVASEIAQLAPRGRPASLPQSLPRGCQRN